MVNLGWGLKLDNCLWVMLPPSNFLALRLDHPGKADEAMPLTCCSMLTDTHNIYHAATPARGSYLRVRCRAHSPNYGGSG